MLMPLFAIAFCAMATTALVASSKPVLLMEDLEPVRFSAEGNPPDVTADGRWLAFGVADRKSQAERLVYVRDLQTGDTRCLTDRDSKDGWASGPRWSPDGRWLAFFVKRDGRTRLALWDRLRDHTELVVDAPLPRVPISVSWSERGASLFVVTDAGDDKSRVPARDQRDQREQRDKAGQPSSQVTVWRSTAAKKVDARMRPDTADAAGSNTEFDDGMATSQVFKQQAAELPSHDVWEVTIEGDRPVARRLLRGAAIDYMAVSPDGGHLAIFGNTRLRTENALFSNLVDLYVVKLAAPRSSRSTSETSAGPLDTLDTLARWTMSDGEALKPVAKDIWQDISRKGLSWSPDGRTIAYVNGGVLGTGDVHVVRLRDPNAPVPSSSATLNLTSSLGTIRATEIFEDDKSPSYRKLSYGNRDPNGAPLWTADGKAIVRAAGGDIWYVPLSVHGGSRGGVRNLTTADSDHHFTAVLGRVDSSGIRQAMGDQKSVLVHAIDARSFREGIWRVRFDDGQVTPVVETEQAIGIGTGYGDVAESTGDFVTAAAAFNAPSELWAFSITSGGGSSAGPGAGLRQLTSLNGERPGWLDRLVRRELQWKTPSGQLARGELILPVLPATTTGARRPPVLMHGYPGARRASESRRFGITTGIEAPALLERGYAVFIIDIPMPERGSYVTDGASKALVDSVEAGVTALIGTGLVDAGRIAVQGHSYGGEMVNTLLTRSRLFAAGIAGSAPSNHTSLAGSSPFGMVYYTAGQGRMGEPLWAAPDRYVSNSPIFFIDRVTAPLLLYHGEQDQAVPIEQAEQMYRALAFLSGDVTLLRYKDKSHTFSDTDVKRDLWSRILDWLDSRLDAATESSH
jgi:dipeptidyl aminopeptidase/acylaminoacyl peptidase